MQVIKQYIDKSKTKPGKVLLKNLKFSDYNIKGINIFQIYLFLFSSKK